jgi:hypothetical protein
MTIKSHKRSLAAAIGIAALGGMCIFAPEARSADHRDGDATTADPAADINDVYTWVEGSNMVLAMTVFPNGGDFGIDAGTPAFSNAVQYVFHTTSEAAYGPPVDGSSPMPVDIICTFASNTSASCWVGTSDYVTGDPSMAASPLMSAKGTQVFAGQRGDPFHFDLQGFKDVEAAVIAAAGGLKFTGAGCPELPKKTATALVSTLAETTSASNPAKKVADDFATANTLAIVVSVPITMLNKGGPIVSVWAATYGM